MYCTAAAGQAESVKVLLEHGANPNSRNKPGSTPLRYAAAYESELTNKKLFQGVTELLLANNANINLANDQGND